MGYNPSPPCLLQERRHDEFVSTKKEIIACMDDLEQQPESSFEMDVMCEDEEAFCLSDDNIAALKLLLGQVIERYFPSESLLIWLN